MEIEDLVPADPKSILISATPITEDPWFGVDGYNDSRVKTIIVTWEGLQVV